jgi:hypothetical protein
MTTQHKATPEQWAELTARVEALEAAQQPTIKESLTDAPAGSLVERVADSLCCDPDLHGKARAAIREVAAFARAKDINGQPVFPSWDFVAQWLEQEASQ